MRRALVTGASRGIGRAIAMALAEDGLHVLAHARTQTAAAGVVDAIAAAGGSAAAISADLADPAAVRGFFTTPGLTEGGLDIVVLNAGIDIGRKTLDAVTEAELDRIVQVNFKAPFLLLQASLPHLNDGARIVLISSVAVRTPFRALIAYTPTKAALEALVGPLAVELGPRGITVNAVRPGATETDMNPIAADPARAAAVVGAVALRRIGQPEDIARVVRFLVGPDGGWVTGQYLDASGGQRL